MFTARRLKPGAWEQFRRADAAETQRADRLSAFLEQEHVSGVFEVIDVVEG